jgi:hypothetical protein
MIRQFIYEQEFLSSNEATQKGPGNFCCDPGTGARLLKLDTTWVRSTDLKRDRNTPSAFSRKPQLSKVMKVTGGIVQ